MIELVLDDIEQSPMQPLYERQGIEIERPDMVELSLTIGRFDRFDYGLHADAFHIVFCYYRRALFSHRCPKPYGRRLKIGLNCRINFGFISEGKSAVISNASEIFYAMFTLPDPAVPMDRGRARMDASNHRKGRIKPRRKS